MKKRSQAVRNRSQIAFSWPRVTAPIVFHSACSFLISSAVWIQLVESASASARSHSAIFFARFSARASACAAKCASQRAHDLVVRRLEAAPQRLALRARHVGGLPPLLLQLADATRHGFGILDRPERLHLFAELFLDADVRPPLPLGDLAQFLHLGRQRGLRGLQPLHDLVVVLLRRQRRHVGERGAHVAQRALGGLQREVRLLDERVGASERAG